MIVVRNTCKFNSLKALGFKRVLPPWFLLRMIQNPSRNLLQKINNFYISLQQAELVQARNGRNSLSTQTLTSFPLQFIVFSWFTIDWQTTDSHNPNEQTITTMKVLHSIKSIRSRDSEMNTNQSFKRTNVYNKLKRANHNNPANIKHLDNKKTEKTHTNAKHIKLPIITRCTSSITVVNITLSPSKHTQKLSIMTPNSSFKSNRQNFIIKSRKQKKTYFFFKNLSLLIPQIQSSTSQSKP